MLIFGERHGVVGQVFWSLLISKKKDEKNGIGKKKPPTTATSTATKTGWNEQPANEQATICDTRFWQHVCGYFDRFFRRRVTNERK